MARQRLNLQEYQQDILSRLKSVTESDAVVAASRLGVQIADVFYLIDLNDINEVLPVPEFLRVPLTQAWFLGMANVRGNLYGITDLSRFLHGVPASINAQSRILLAHDRYDINAALLVDRLVGLRNLEAMQYSNNKKNKEDILKYTDEGGQQWQELDISLLLERNDFMQVAA